MYLSDVNVLSSHNEVGTYVIHSHDSYYSNIMRLRLPPMFLIMIIDDATGISKGEREECILMGRVH